MDENNGDGGSGVSSTDTRAASEQGTFRTLLAKYDAFQESASTVTPRIVKVIELVLAIVLLVGTAYWAYSYLVVGA